MKARQLTQKFADAKLGVISLAARYALDNQEEEQYLLEMHSQLGVHAPESARKIYGEELATELEDYYNAKYKA